MEEGPKKRQFPTVLLALVLWLLTAALGLQVIYSAREIFYWVYLRLGGYISTAESLGIGVVFLLAIVFLIFIVYTTEYHMAHTGSRKSWLLFGWTLAVEVGLILVYYLILLL